MVTYPCWDFKLIHVSKGAQGVHKSSMHPSPIQGAFNLNATKRCHITPYSTSLVQVMSCCLTVLTHYLIQTWRWTNSNVRTKSHWNHQHLFLIRNMRLNMSSAKRHLIGTSTYQNLCMFWEILCINRIRLSWSLSFSNKRYLYFQNGDTFNDLVYKTLSIHAIKIFG